MGVGLLPNDLGQVFVALHQFRLFPSARGFGSFVLAVDVEFDAGVAVAIAPKQNGFTTNIAKSGPLLAHVPAEVFEILVDCPAKLRRLRISVVVPLDRHQDDLAVVVAEKVGDVHLEDAVQRTLQLHLSVPQGERRLAFAAVPAHPNVEEADADLQLSSRPFRTASGHTGLGRTYPVESPGYHESQES